MSDTTLSILAVRLTHTGKYADGRPCTTSVLITDTDFGFELQTRKTPAYVPAGGFIELPLTSRTLYSLSKGNIAGFLRAGVLRVDTFIRLRNFADKGGPGGLGVGLAPLVPNITRQGGLLKFLLLVTESSGYILGEEIQISGLAGAFSALNGTYTISGVQKNSDFVGPNPGAYLVEVPSAGPDIASDTLGGVTIELVNGKIGVELSGSGNAGGFGSDAMAYVGGQANVVLGVDPTYVELTPTPDPTPSGSLFVQPGGALCFKDLGGVIQFLTGGPVGVSSFNGRNGAVFSILGDYAASLIGNDAVAPAPVGGTVKSALESLGGSVATAQTTANNAQATANNAQTAAGIAQATAIAAGVAAGIADGKAVTAQNEVNALEAVVAALTSSNIANISGVPNSPTVTEALNTLLSYKPAIQVLRTEADFQDPPGDHILPAGVSLVVGLKDFIPGLPPVLQLEPGSRIIVPPGASLVSLSSRGAVVFGDADAALISAQGGDVCNLIIANMRGGSADADIEHTKDVFSHFDDLLCVGRGIGVALRGQSDTLQFTGSQISCEIDNSAARGIVLEHGSRYAGISLEATSNNLGIDNHVGFDIESGAIVLSGISFTNGLFIGGNGAANTTGIRLDGGASVPSRTVTNTVFTGFTGPGSKPLAGLSASEPQTFISGCMGVANTAPVAALELDASTSITPPTVTLVAANSWYPLSPLGSNLNAFSSLFDVPATGQIRSLSPTGITFDVRAFVSLERPSGALVVVRVRITTSPDGVTWTPQGIPQSFEISTTSTQLAIPAIVSLPTSARIRLEASSTTAAVALNIRSFYLGARGIV